MSGQVGYKGIKTLKVGDQLEYSAGMEGHYMSAIVTVTREPGTTGVCVRIDTILEKGDLASINEGDEIIAGATELYS